MGRSISTTIQTSVLASNRHNRRREKVFGEGRPKPLTIGIKKRLMRLARAAMRSAREPNKPWGKISAKHLEVFEVLLWGFHNAATGLCFPSYEAIAEKAGCARSTVYEAIKALEAAGLLTWVHRLKRVYERVKDMFGDGVHGQRTRVERTWNGYRFPDPPDVESSKSELRSGTVGQNLFSCAGSGAGGENCRSRTAGCLGSIPKGYFGQAPGRRLTFFQKRRRSAPACNGSDWAAYGARTAAFACGATTTRGGKTHQPGRQPPYGPLPAPTGTTG